MRSGGGPPAAAAVTWVRPAAACGRAAPPRRGARSRREAESFGGNRLAPPPQTSRADVVPLGTSGTRHGAAALLLAGVTLAGCGSSTASAPARPPSHRVVERFYGKGADSVWVFRRQNERPSAVVVFLHGLYDRIESTPLNHLDFVRHLAGRGYAVVYPRFEKVPGQTRAPLHALSGTVIGLRAIGYRGKAPVVVIGYSRGGGLALDLAGLLPGANVLASGVLSVFPALMDPPLPDYRSIPPTSPIVLLVGDRDTNVSHYGRDQIVQLLRLQGLSARERAHGRDPLDAGLPRRPPLVHGQHGARAQGVLGPRRRARRARDPDARRLGGARIELGGDHACLARLLDEDVIRAGGDHVLDLRGDMPRCDDEAVAGCADALVLVERQPHLVAAMRVEALAEELVLVPRSAEAVRRLADPLVDLTEQRLVAGLPRARRNLHLLPV